MGGFSEVYKVSLANHRRKAKRRVSENEMSYNSLKNKESSYARSIKALGDLHKQVSEIYNNAEDDILRSE